MKVWVVVNGCLDNFLDQIEAHGNNLHIFLSEEKAKEYRKKFYDALDNAGKSREGYWIRIVKKEIDKHYW